MGQAPAFNNRTQLGSQGCYLCGVYWVLPFFGLQEGEFEMNLVATKTELKETKVLPSPVA